MKAIIKVTNQKVKLISKETYQTIKLRTLDSGMFVEVTVDKTRKILLNKMAIESISQEVIE